MMLDVAGGILIAGSILGVFAFGVNGLVGDETKGIGAFAVLIALAGVAVVFYLR